MMKDHSGCKRAFIRPNRAWYSTTEKENEVNFGMYDDEGGTSGEMTMAWVQLGLGGRSVPQLQVFDDAWSALASFGDLVQELGRADGENISPSEFVDILIKCKFRDKTEYKEE